MEVQTNVLDTVTKAAPAVVQAILTNMLTRCHLSRCTRAAELESSDGSREKAEQLIRSICITVTMQLNMFADERMKILYALSFIHEGIVQVWAENETNVILSHSSTFSTLTELLAGIKRTFGDPDLEKMAHTQLHALKMIMGMMADEYTSKLEMLVGRTSFNKVALDDTFNQGFHQLILSKFTPRPHYHQAWTIGRQSCNAIWITSIGDSLS